MIVTREPYRTWGPVTGYYTFDGKWKQEFLLDCEPSLHGIIRAMDHAAVMGFEGDVTLRVTRAEYDALLTEADPLKRGSRGISSLTVATSVGRVKVVPFPDDLVGDPRGSVFEG